MTSLRDIDDQLGVVHPTDPEDLAAAAACVTRRISDEGDKHPTTSGTAQGTAWARRTT